VTGEKGHLREAVRPTYHDAHGCELVVFNVEGLSSDPKLETAMSMVIANAMAGRASGRSGQPSVTVLDECWFLLDLLCSRLKLWQLFRTARKGTPSVWGIRKDARRLRRHRLPANPYGPGIVKNTSTKIVGPQPGDVSTLINHLSLNDVAVGEIKRFSAPRKGKERRGAARHRRESGDHANDPNRSDARGVLVCTTFPRERRVSALVLGQERRPATARLYNGTGREVSFGAGGRGAAP